MSEETSHMIIIEERLCRIEQLIQRQSDRALTLREADSKRLENLEQSIVQRAENVAVESKNVAVESKDLAIQSKQLADKNRVSLQQAIGVGKLLFTATIIFFVFNTFWTVLPLSDRQELARKGLFPIAGSFGLGAIVFIYGKEIASMIGLGSSDNDSEDGENGNEKRETKED